MTLLTVIVLSVLMNGCSSLILRDDDNAGQTAGKVTARTLVAVPTLGISEAFVGKAKRREAHEAKLADQDAYFGKQCAKEGVEPGTQEYRGCISVKREEMERRTRPQ